MKNEIERYDLDRVYRYSDYKKAVAYAEQNINVIGVKEQLNSLKAEKERYNSEMAAIVERERDTERDKYESYKKWATVFVTSKKAFIGSLVGLIPIAILENFLPSLLAHILDLLVSLGLFGGGPVAAISYLGQLVKARQYQKYRDEISKPINSLGSAFAQFSQQRYNIIDNLYLNTLDSMQRQLVLMQREQAAQNKKLLQAEKERQSLQLELIAEQRKSRAVQEELLAIERKREEKYK